MGVAQEDERETPLWQKVLFVACMAVIIAWLVGSTTGCGPLPLRSRLDPATLEITTVEVGYTLPETGVVMTASDVDTTQAGLGLLGWLGVGLSVAGGLGLVGPKSWANWSAILKPSTSWKGTAQAAGALVGLTHTPAEAKSNETGKPEPGHA